MHREHMNQVGSTHFPLKCHLHLLLIACYPVFIQAYGMHVTIIAVTSSQNTKADCVKFKCQEVDNFLCQCQFGFKTMPKYDKCRSWKRVGNAFQFPRSSSFDTAHSGFVFWRSIVSDHSPTMVWKPLRMLAERAGGANKLRKISTKISSNYCS